VVEDDKRATFQSAARVQNAGGISPVASWIVAKNDGYVILCDLAGENAAATVKTAKGIEELVGLAKESKSPPGFTVG
jgi:hypothetical protein